MDKKEKNNAKKSKYGKNYSEDIYEYDFVPTLSHTLNIDEQKTKARELEDIDK